VSATLKIDMELFTSFFIKDGLVSSRRSGARAGFLSCVETMLSRLASCAKTKRFIQKTQTISKGRGPDGVGRIDGFDFVSYGKRTRSFIEYGQK